MPGVQQPTVLDTVHRTCQQVAELHPWVSINKEAVQKFVSGLDAAAVKAAGSKGNVFPIKFDNLEAEVTFLCLYHLLDFGSGYEAELQAANKRGAAETIQYGCFGLALSAKRLDGPWMRAFSPYHVHNAFGIESKVEQQLQPGISISKPGPLAPLASAIQSAVVEAGKCLESLGVKSLGQFVVAHLGGLKQAGKPITAASLVEELADNFPGFQDSGLVTPPTADACNSAAAADDAAAAAAAAASDSGGSSGDAVKVVFLRKAQALAADLAARFAGQDERFVWSDMDKLSADSGALLPAILQQLGILTYSDQLSQQLEQQQQQLPQGSEERALRAAAVAAVDEIVAAAAAAAAGGGAGGVPGFSARDVSSYLLSLVTEEGPQALFQGAVLKSHRTVGTNAY